MELESRGWRIACCECQAQLPGPMVGSLPTLPLRAIPESMFRQCQEVVLMSVAQFPLEKMGTSLAGASAGTMWMCIIVHN